MTKEHCKKFDKAIEEYNKTHKEQLSLLDIALSAITIEAYERGEFNGQIQSNR
jgi:hypothetical protein